MKFEQNLMIRTTQNLEYYDKQSFTMFIGCAILKGFFFFFFFFFFNECVCGGGGGRERMASSIVILEAKETRDRTVVL